MKKFLGYSLLSLILLCGCSITGDHDVACVDIECNEKYNVLESNFNVISNQLSLLQIENDEQKKEIEILQNSCSYSDLSGEIKELNEKISRLQQEKEGLMSGYNALLELNSGLYLKIERYLDVIKKLKSQLAVFNDELTISEYTGGQLFLSSEAKIYSANKIDTHSIYTEGCDWTTKTLSQYDYYEDMPNSNWTNDIKFVNKALQDVRDNGEHLIKNYVDEANRVLDSAGLTKRDQCRYSLLIDELENQQGFIRSYKNENGKITIGIDFISYKENITWDDCTFWYGERRVLTKNTSTKVRYYTVSDNAEFETVNVDNNGVLPIGPGISYTKFINNWNTRLNNFCNNEPIYYHIDEDNTFAYETYGEYYNHNGGDRDRYCIKRQIESGGTAATFSFDNEGQIKKIMKTYYFDSPRAN